VKIRLRNKIFTTEELQESISKVHDKFGW